MSTTSGRDAATPARAGAAGQGGRPGRPSPAAGPAATSAAPTPTVLAKGALRRLAQAQQEPTPENFARAFAEEAAHLGVPVAPAPAPAAPAPVSSPAPAAREATAAEPAARTDGDEAAAEAGRQWTQLVMRLSRQLDRGGRQWTNGRRKDSLQRVLAGSRSDPARLLQRLGNLITAWEGDSPLDPVEAAEAGLAEAPSADRTAEAPTDRAAATAADTPLAAEATGSAALPAADAETTAQAAAAHRRWASALGDLQGTVQVALPLPEPAAATLADALSRCAGRIARDGATAAALAELGPLCESARNLLGQRHHLLKQLTSLCREMSLSLTELAEDDSWSRGQCEAVQASLGLSPAASGEPTDGAVADPARPAAAGPRRGETPEPPLSVRSVRAASALLQQTRRHHRQVRQERLAARDSLKQLLAGMLREVGELGEQTGRFQLATEAHAQAIAQADTLESLAGVVASLLEDSRAVQGAVQRSQQRLQADSQQAQQLEARVRELEGELRRLSDEVSTDALTQVANRRGLAQAFAQEVARCQRAQAEGGPAPLAVGLIDIDNFKKLNDSLGHAAGDTALKSLAREVRERLRPQDHLARFGGEEFVVLLPATEQAEAQRALTRLQRSLSEALFLHDGREVFVTFSAGVTEWRDGETLEAALERADGALYEAKRTGKNRTCAA